MISTIICIQQASVVPTELFVQVRTSILPGHAKIGHVSIVMACVIERQHFSLLCSHQELILDKL